MKATKKSNVRIKIEFDSELQREQIAKMLSYECPGAKFSPAYKAKLWSGTKCFLTETDTMSIGFFKSLFPEHSLVYDREFVDITFDDIRLYCANPHLERRQYQLDAINIILKNKIGLCAAVMGAGKCLGIDTPITMFDGTIKKVQDIVTGDTLLGPDGRKRNVISTTSGKDNLYKVTPIKGDPYITNSVHLLSLKLTSGVPHNFMLSDGTIINKNNTTSPIYVETEVFYNSNTCKNWFKAWRPEAISFEDETISAKLPIPPYILGIWLGDGTSSSPEITNVDASVIEEFKNYATSIGCKLLDTSSKDRTSRYHLSKNTAKINLFMKELRNLNLINNKHIPLMYKKASIQDRLELLAGLLDTDGSLSNNCFDFIQKRKQLSEDVIFLCRSLGLAAYLKKCTKTITKIGFSGEYYRVSISGNCSIIPNRITYKKAIQRAQKKNVLRTSISVEKAGYGDYYGFEIDGDRQFLLGDWQVTHNTLISAAVCSYHISKKPSNKILFVVYDRNILSQTMTNFKKYGLNVSQFGDSIKDLSGDIVVATIQSLNRIENPRVVLKNISFVFCDEAHHSKSTSSKSVLSKLPNCEYFIGLTATPYEERTLETADLTSVLGPIIYRYGFSEGVRDNNIVPIKAFFLDMAPDLDIKELVFERKNYKYIWDTAIQYNSTRNNQVGQILSSLSSVLNTTQLVLVDRVEHGTSLSQELSVFNKLKSICIYGDDDICMRALKRESLSADNTINTLISTVCKEGIDFKVSPVVAVNASGRKNFVSLIQFLGRVVRKNDEFGNFRVYIDFIDRYHSMLYSHSLERIEACKKYGIEVVTCKSIQDLLIEIVKYYKNCNK